MTAELAGKRATGRNAQSIKYDLLTALGAHGCAGDKHLQRLALRLITLIVARYNWVTEELSVGQREIASLWCIDERSVKREFARLRELGWLEVRRAAARGRVAVYRMDIAAIQRSTRAAWDNVGTDYVARMTGEPAAPPPAASNVISFPAPSGEGGLWPRMQAQLFREDAHSYGAWFAALTCQGQEGGALHLTAPSRFHAAYICTNHLAKLERMARALDPAILRVEVAAEG